MSRSSAVFVFCLVFSLGCGGAGLSSTNAGTYGSAAPAGAVVNAAAAGVLWAVAGCKLQGCPYGTFCDTKSGYCEVRKCSEGCPDDTICNEGLGRCQAAPPAQTPNDFLPEDNIRNQPPGFPGQ